MILDNADILSRYQLNSIQKNDVQIASPAFIWDSVKQRRLLDVKNYDPKSLAVMSPPGDKSCVGECVLPSPSRVTDAVVDIWTCHRCCEGKNCPGILQNTSFYLRHRKQNPEG